MIAMLFLLLSVFIASSNSISDKYQSDILKIFNHIPFNVSRFLAETEPNFARSLFPEVKANDINYYLSTRDMNYVMMNDRYNLVNPKWKVKIIVHGWTEHSDVIWIKNATEAYLKRSNYNVIVPDWSKLGDTDYMSACIVTPDVGKAIGDWIMTLHKRKRIPYKNFHLISHSLGCQVAGFVGKRVLNVTSKKLGRITALDAAAPLFFMLPEDRRLNSKDAAFVDIYHTDGGVLGFKDPIGTADFYPNGGSAMQPGCSLIRPDVTYDDLFCSHAKSHHFFIETINNKLGHARACPSWDKFTSCPQNDSIIYGEYANPRISGIFFLKTDEDGISQE